MSLQKLMSLNEGEFAFRLSKEEIIVNKKLDSFVVRTKILDITVIDKDREPIKWLEPKIYE